ncbi:MAG: protein kinase [Pirellulaceae bacterium]|nr:protein kinase [Pirellulaceae bacterium]
MFELLIERMQGLEPNELASVELLDLLPTGWAEQHPDYIVELNGLMPTLRKLAREEMSLAGRETRSDLIPSQELRAKFLAKGFELKREVGRGGMGIVYEAMETSLQRQVAIKVLSPHLLANPIARQRFRNEACAVTKIDHPGIVNIYCVDFEDEYFFVMRYIDGKSLSDLSLSRDRLSHFPGMRVLIESLALAANPNQRARWQRLLDETLSPSSPDFLLCKADLVAEMGRQAAETLACAHQAGIVHRDIKPSNLMLDQQGRVWITDFGLARIENTDNLTESGFAIGTVRYMSPEQLGSVAGAVTFRTDIFSLGATFLELFIEHLRTDVSRIPIAMRRDFLEIDQARGKRYPIPRDLQTILTKAANPSPQSRYAAASELAADFEAFLQRRPIKAKHSWLSDFYIGKLKSHSRIALAALVASAVLLSCLGVLGYLLVKERRLRSDEKSLVAQQSSRLQAELKSEQAERRYAEDLSLAFQKWKSLDAPGALVILARWIPDSADADMRGFEWYYLQTLIKEKPSPLLAQAGESYSAEFSVDGQQLVVTGSDGVHVIDTTTWQTTQHLQQHQGEVTGAEFSADGQWLVTAGADQRLIIWDTIEWQPSRFIDYPLPVMSAQYIDGDQSLIVAGRSSNDVNGENTVSRIDLHTGQAIWRWREAGPWLQCCLACEAQQQVFVGSHQGLTVLNLSSGQVITSNAVGPVRSLEFVSDESLLLSGSVKGDLFAWQVRSNELVPLGRLEVASDAIESIHYHPAIQYSTFAARDGVFGVVSASDSLEQPIALKYTFQHSEPIWYARMTPDTKSIVMTDRAGLVTRYALDENWLQLPQHVDASRFQSLTAEERKHAAKGSTQLAISSDEQLLADSQPNSPVRIWDSRELRMIKEISIEDILREFPDLDPIDATLGPIDFVPGSHALSVNVSRNWIVVDPITGKPARDVLAGRVLKARSLAWDPLCRFVCAISHDAVATAYDVHSATLQYEFPDRIAAANWSRDGQRLLLGTFENGLAIYDSASWQELRRIACSGLNDEGSCDISVDNRTLAISRTDRIELWSTATGTKFFDIPHPPRWPSVRVRFSSDGRSLITEGYLRELEQYHFGPIADLP